MFRLTFYRAACLMALTLMLTAGLSAADNDKPTDVTGDWELTAETPFGNFTSTMKLERKGDVLLGRNLGMNGKETKLNNVKLAGKTLSFDQDIEVIGMALHLVYTGMLEREQFKGTFDAHGQTMTWTAKRPTAAIAGPPGVAGTWKLSVETPNGPRERTLVLKQDGEKLTGTLSGPMDQPLPLEEVSLKGRELRFAVSVERNGATVKRSYVASLDGDTLKGNVEGGNQTRAFTARRQAAPAAAVTVGAGGVAGTWKLAVVAPDMTYHPTLVVMEQEGKWSGKFQVEKSQEAPLKEVVVKGNQLDFVVDIMVSDQMLHLKFSGTVEGDRLKGTISPPDQSYVTTGERQPEA